jgi:hypothetical protein
MALKPASNQGATGPDDDPGDLGIREQWHRWNEVE